jgi:formate dehydrogenase subunit delta
MSADKIVHMANQIARFMESKPVAEGRAGFAQHINDFWEPRMRRQLFEALETAPSAFRPLVLDAAELIRLPAAA